MKTYPLLQSQMGIFLEWMGEPSATRYNLPCFLSFSKKISAEQLEAALLKLIKSRRVLQTRIFIDENGNPRQYSDSNLEIGVLRREMSDEELTNYKLKGFVRPYDLLSGEPLCRFEIIETPTQNAMFFELHHIIGDGLTLAPNITLNDFPKAFYGEELPEIPFGMYEYAELEEENLESDAYGKAKQYYAEKFAGMNFTSLGQLPADCTGNSIHEDAYIPAATIDDWCRENGTQSNLLFMAAFSFVASIVSREENVVFSSINHGRMDKRLRNAYGMFVKSNPILASITPDKSVIDFIKGFRMELMSTIRYGAYPFSHFCRDLKMTPTIEFGFQGVAMQEYLEIDGEKIYAEQLDRGKSSSNLTCIIYLDKGNYDIRLTASDAIFSREKLEMLAKTIKNTTLNMMADPMGLLKNVSVMGEAERKQVEALRVTAQEDIPWKLYYQPIEENATKYAERTALIAKDRTLTFAEFNVEANRVAHALIRKGVKRGDRVVLLLPRRSCVIVSMFGVSKAGAAYIPCDPEYPADRINLIMTDSEAQYIITTPEHAAAYPSEKVILIDDIYNIQHTEPGDDMNPNVDVTPEDLAYLIYTSGSTGRPKGVMLRHCGIANYLYDHPANIHIHRMKELGVKSFVSITTLSFDMSLKEFAGSLFNGITCIFADEEEIMDASLLADLMNRTQAEGINGTCSRMQSYVELPAFCDALKNCKVVWAGGEVYPMQLLFTLQAMGVHIFNTYGPTEITVSSNIAELTHEKSVNVGRPLLNYVEFIVDRFDNEIPIGFVGELLIGGPGVAVGYNNLPEMTKERFVNYKGERVYRSGDLARWKPDGKVEILGRTDNQVKLRGFRIELGEIENKAILFEGIKQAVADVKNIGTMQHLCLYYTSDQEVDEEQLQTFLSESLTEYMVPTAYIAVDTIPLTPNGKIDRKRLPAPKIKLKDIVAPATEIEQKIFDLVAETLQTKDFGVTNNLVGLGLSSLLSMRLGAKLQKELGLHLMMKEIMENPTVRELAALASDAAHIIDKEVAFKPHPVQEFYPMTDSQRSMYLDCLMYPDSIIYNIPCYARFKGMDVDRLEASIREVIEAHPYMKVRLKEVGDDVVQVRDDNAPVKIGRERLTVRPTKELLQSYIHPFDLKNEPLYRFNILEFMDEVYLLADMHHLVTDGTSNNVIMNDLMKVYHGEKLQKEEYTAYDRALDEDALIKSERALEAESYFDKLVGGIDNTVYPHSTTPDNTKKQGVVETEISCVAIDAYCKRHSLTPGNFFMEVFHQVLHRITREENTLLYFISNGRSELMLENFFGVLVKTLPAVETSFKGSMADIVEAMGQQINQTVKNDFYPFTKIVERHKLKAEIIFNYVVDMIKTSDLGTECIESQVLEWDMAKTPLSITMQRAANGNYLSVIEYDTKLYSLRDMEILNQAFRTFAENCVKPEYHDVSLVPLLSVEEQLEMKEFSKGQCMEYDVNETFPSIFIQQAQKTPQNKAVVDENGDYTYAELNALSASLAKKMVELGVGQKNSPFVSIMLGYQKEFVVAALGVERAGGAYVPLDYDYPNDRLLYMLEDSESNVLITSHAIMDEKNTDGNFKATNILYIDDFLKENQGEDGSDFNLSTPEGLAYMIYTSGSTGKPKGVMISHLAKTNFVHFIAKEWKHTEKSRICCHSSFSFDASIEDLYPVLTVGGTLYTVPQEARKDMELLHKFIIDNGITGGCYTTQLGIMLLQQYPDLPVDYLVVGGEKMAANPNCKTRLINTYGPTEFTVDATYFVTEPGKEYKNIPIGRPLHNSYAFVVDSYGQLVPKGVAGELCMAGRQVASGYWKREELTAEKFVKCPMTGEKMYHTGDLVKYNEDGNIEYLGRIDSQVKLRGFRIELGEIESLIANYPGILMESVQVREISGVQHLCAYYTADHEIDVDDLKKYLAGQLTDYMVPTAYMQLDEMPLTPNGKVNSKALSEPVVKAEEIIAPETEMEKKVFDLVVETLKHNQFGVTSNLVSMGLTSLVAMRLGVQIFNTFNVTLKLADVMIDPTVRNIAGMIKESQKKDSEDVFKNIAAKAPATDAPAKKKINLFAKKNK